MGKAGSTESLELSRCAETKQKILQSTIFCIHRDAGCAWAGPLGKLKGHLNTCQKDAAACRNQCGAKIARVVMEDHMKYTCTKRTVNCLYCRRPFTGATVEEHQSACGFEPLFCERKCGQKVARNRIKAHQVNTCSKRLVSCKYCERSYTAETLQSHQIKCPKFLVPCPNRCGFNCAREEIELHMDECDYYEEECRHAEAGCRWKGSPLALEKHLADNAKRHLDISLSHTKRQAEYIEKLKMELERAATSYTGVLVWKISDITAKMEEARENEGLELVSLPFYTSQCGSKLPSSSMETAAEKTPTCPCTSKSSPGSSTLSSSGPSSTPSPSPSWTRTPTARPPSTLWSPSFPTPTGPTSCELPKRMIPISLGSDSRSTFLTPCSA